MLDLVLFDCDGTLVDSEAMIVGTMASAFEACGLPAPTVAASRSTIGLSLPEAIARLAGAHDNPPIDDLVAAYRASYLAAGHDLSRTAPLFAGARAALDALNGRGDTLLGIVTGKGRRGLDALLDVHGLKSHFAVLRTGDDGPSKPHPFMVLDAVAAVGGEAARTVVVGDTGFDIEMGKAAGALTLGVTWGYHPRERLEVSGADAIAERYADVPALVDRLLGRGA